MIQAVADRLAEAFAEYLHEHVRKVVWGYAGNENLSNDELIREKYQGSARLPGIRPVRSIPKKAVCGRY
ncbi:5-methyltetrahydrofolate-homocysteine methyltransferase [Photobacterium aphoticum]|uniref:5-methyltetrahydrofolate-homocysteine methyltransferase n=1 Tax=Photobacterium aphoticum TaxID=754436 RepID=A0A090QT34_9GAMM|nr:5-methyltetrahydrofolate-homocysteine methyltransferase [Photobacterium aphoticum]